MPSSPSPSHHHSSTISPLPTPGPRYSWLNSSSGEKEHCTIWYRQTSIAIENAPIYGHLVCWFTHQKCCFFSHCFLDVFLCLPEDIHTAGHPSFEPRLISSSVKKRHGKQILVTALWPMARRAWRSNLQNLQLGETCTAGKLEPPWLVGGFHPS